MKLRLVLTGLVLLASFGFSSFGARKEPTEKSWRFVRSEIWLGALSRDQSVPVIFEVENDQDVPLRIAATDASCRCIVLDSAPAEIPAHGAGSFRWRFNAARSHGTVMDTVSVTGEDGRRIVGTFKAFVAEEDLPKAR